MSALTFAISPAFPSVCPLSIIVGTAFSEATSFVVQRPVLGAVFQKAHRSTSNKEILESKETQNAFASLVTSVSASALQSYAVSALLKLTNVTSYKGAAIIGSLILAVQNGPALVEHLFVAKLPFDVVLASLALKAVDTVGLALAIQAYRQSGSSAPEIPKVTTN